MSEFRTLLRDVAARLEAPHRARVRILEELDGDLADLTAELQAQGLSVEDARRRAAELLVPSPDVARVLAYVHRPLWERLASRFSEAGRHRVERGVLIIATVLVMSLTLGTLAATGLLRQSSPYLAGVLALGGLAVALALLKGYQAYLRGEPSPERLRFGLGAFLVIGAGAIGLAALGVVSTLAETAGRIAENVAQQGPLLLDWLRAAVTLAGLGLVVVLGCGLGWLWFARRAAVVEQEMVRVLGRPEAAADPALVPSNGGGAADFHRINPGR